MNDNASILDDILGRSTSYGSSGTGPVVVSEHVLGGFIDCLAFNLGYAEEFVRNFPDFRCRLDDDGLVRYWHYESRKTVSKAAQERVEWWRHGYRSALRQWRPADYK